MRAKFDQAAPRAIDLIEDGRGTQAVHEVVVAMRAARRSGRRIPKRKRKSICPARNRGGKKGTGRARAGYKSSVIWRGGGVVFGPKPRDYSKKVSKSVRRLAFQRSRHQLNEARTWRHRERR